MNEKISKKMFRIKKKFYFYLNYLKIKNYDN
jgi:hypothetical protein